MIRHVTFAVLAIAAHLGIAWVGPVQGQPTDPMNEFELRTHDSPAGSISYRLHVPAEWSSPRRLVVMLHGCLQDAADFAAGTGMNAIADESGFAVLYPQQGPERNPQKCWNWFDAAQQRSDGPEVARIVSLLDAVTEALDVDVSRVDLAGISAGAAMANVLAVSHPDRFARVALHSGIAWGAAGNIAEGMTAMQTGGPETIDLEDRRLDAFLGADRPVAVMVLQGASDPAVAPVNGARSAERWARLFEAKGAALGRTDVMEAIEGGRSVRTVAWRREDGTTAVEWLEIQGLGHAWSGGRPEGSYTDPDGPSASRLVARFFGLLP